MITQRVYVFDPAGPKTRAPIGHSWESLMARALALASRAGENGEIPVGALVVSPDGSILGESANAVEKDFDPTAHAEIIAIRKAASKIRNHRLEGCVLVSTLEPCSMCAAAIAQARLSGVVFGASDHACGAVVSRFELLASFPGQIWHMGGIRASQCAALLMDFFNARRKA